MTCFIHLNLHFLLRMLFYLLFFMILFRLLRLNQFLILLFYLFHFYIDLIIQICDFSARIVFSFYFSLIFLFLLAFLVLLVSTLTSQVSWNQKFSRLVYLRILCLLKFIPIIDLKVGYLSLFVLITWTKYYG